MSNFTFRPAKTYNERLGLFVALTGGTNSGKTVSGVRLARGIAGPEGRVAVLDTEGGRTIHLKSQFDFDVNIMDPPFRPARFAEAAEAAEAAGYAALLIDSFTMEWRGIGGVLDWEEENLKRMAGDDFKKRERCKQAARIEGRMAHKSMVFSFLQRRIPIIFSIRGEESIIQVEGGGKPEKVFKSMCSPSFPFEMTIAFRLATEARGVIDLSDPRSWKMEAAHRHIFQDGQQISEAHGAQLEAWSRGADAIEFHLSEINAASAMPQLEAAFSVAWQSIRDAELRKRLLGAKDAKKSALAGGQAAARATPEVTQPPPPPPAAEPEPEQI